MTALLAWLTSLWPRLPKELRVALLASLVAGGMAGGLVVGYMAWSSGYITEALGGVVKQQDLEEQTQELREMGSDATEAAASTAFAAYDHNLRNYLAHERQYAVDTILNPLLGAIRKLDVRQRQMQASQKDANAKLEELPKAYDEKLERLMRAAQAGNTSDRTEELLHQVLQRMEEQDEQLRELRSGGRRTKKQEF